MRDVAFSIGKQDSWNIHYSCSSIRWTSFMCLFMFIFLTPVISGKYIRFSLEEIWMECVSTFNWKWNQLQWVRCRYNAVNFLTNIHKRHPIARPLGRGNGCLLWIQHLIDILPQSLHKPNGCMQKIKHHFKRYTHHIHVNWHKRDTNIYGCMQKIIYGSPLPYIYMVHLCQWGKFGPF